MKKTDLEQQIRDSYTIIREYEKIVQLSDRPEERLRANRKIEAQNKLISQYIRDYMPLCESLGESPPEDILQLAITVGYFVDNISEPDRKDLQQIHKILVSYFSLEEIKTLCFILGINFDELGGGNLTEKTRELVSYCQHRGKIDDLVNAIRTERPNIGF